MGKVLTSTNDGTNGYAKPAVLISAEWTQEETEAGAPYWYYYELADAEVEAGDKISAGAMTETDYENYYERIDAFIATAEGKIIFRANQSIDDDISLLYSINKLEVG